MRILAILLASVKLLIAIPFVTIGFAIGVVGLECPDYLNRLMGLSVLLGAIGVGYPFSLNRTAGFARWIIVVLSTAPFCFAMVFLRTASPADRLFMGIGLLCIAVTLADMWLSTRPSSAPAGISKRALVWIGSIVLLAVAVVGGQIFLASRGRPYQPPAIVFQGDSEDLRQSVVVPTLDTPVPQHKNVIWCGSMQLAWNHLGKDVLRGPPRVQGAETVASRLNQAALTEDDLPSDSCFATAGFAKDGVAERVKSEMAHRFHKDVEIAALDPNGILAYAYLEASAAFTVPFFDNHGGFRFRDSSGKETEVTSFGIEERHEYAYEALREQVEVLYCLRKEGGREQIEEFVVDLCRSSSPNQIVVACVPPKETLLETLADVETKTHGAKEQRTMEGRPLHVRDVLLVPNLNWEVRHRFAELEGPDKRFLNASFGDYHLGKALQTVRFKLDRAGAELSSEAQIPCKPMATHYVCDRPFLIVVKKRGAERPFFVMWVDNAELLCRP
jgi:hypothetical protein